jgi:hypothetical protein
MELGNQFLLFAGRDRIIMAELNRKRTCTSGNGFQL